MDEKRNRPVTLKDIARETGFSANTVSHALAGKSDISEKTTRLIREKAEEMGYVGNAFASSLRSGVSRLVAVIVGDIANPHFSILIKEIQARLGREGYTVIVFNTEEKQAAERRAVLAALGQKAAGILLCPSPDSAGNVSILQERKVPFVLLGRRLAGSGVDSVICDDRGSGRLAGKFLLENGHRQILFLNGPVRISSAAERQQGVLDALSEAGLPIQTVSVRTVPVIAEKSRSLLPRLLTEKPYTAVLAFSDLLAWETVCALKELGKQVPEDCSVMGFDNIQSRFSYPLRMSTVSSSKAAMANRAVEMLLDRIGDPGRPAQELILPTRLIRGETVSPVSGKA